MQNVRQRACKAAAFVSAVTAVGLLVSLRPSTGRHSIETSRVVSVAGKIQPSLFRGAPLDPKFGVVLARSASCDSPVH
jgi:hypothetical protein